MFYFVGKVLSFSDGIPLFAQLGYFDLLLVVVLTTRFDSRTKWYGYTMFLVIVSDQEVGPVP